MDAKSTFHDAIQAVKDGDKRRARRILRELIKRDPKNEEAWLLFADVAQRRDDTIKCLKQAIKINPSNVIAREKLSKYSSPSMLHFPEFTRKGRTRPLVAHDERVQRNKIALGLLAFASVIFIFIIVTLLCIPLVLLSPSPTYIPEPTLTLKEDMKRSAYFACAKHSYQPYYYPFAYTPFNVDNWTPITTSPLPTSAVTDMGDNRYKVDLHVKYTLVHVEKSPISGEDVVIRNDYQDIWECNAHYRGTENGVRYWDVEILGRKEQSGS